MDLIEKIRRMFGSTIYFGRIEAKKLEKQGKYLEAVLAIEPYFDERYWFAHRMLSKYRIQLLKKYLDKEIETIGNLSEQAQFDDLEDPYKKIRLLPDIEKHLDSESSRVINLKEIYAEKLPYYLRGAWEKRGPGANSKYPLKDICILGDYQILELFGHGQYGSTLLCQRKQDKRKYVVKLIFSPDKKIAENEARIQDLLESTGKVPRVFEKDWIEGDFSDFYMVMEYVSGKNLEEILNPDSLQEITDAVGLVIQISRALEQAHAAGIVHRDIKPKNILLDEDGNIKITDFGISHRIGSKLRPPWAGSIPYIAPEIENGTAGDHRSDIYSVGMILNKFLGKCVEIMDTDTDESRQLQKICQKAIAENPEHRFESMPQLREALEQWLEYPPSPTGVRRIHRGHIDIGGMRFYLSVFFSDVLPVKYELFNEFVSEGFYTPESSRIDNTLVKKIWTSAGFDWLKHSGKQRLPLTLDEWNLTWDKPVYDVTWFEAVAFCNWRSVRELEPDILKCQFNREVAVKLDRILFYNGSDLSSRIKGFVGFRLPTQFELASARLQINNNESLPSDFCEHTSCSYTHLDVLQRYEQKSDPIVFEAQIAEVLVMGSLGRRMGIGRGDFNPDFKQGFRTVRRERAAGFGAGDYLPEKNR